VVLCWCLCTCYPCNRGHIVEAQQLQMVHLVGTSRVVGWTCNTVHVAALIANLMWTTRHDAVVTTI